MLHQHSCLIALILPLSLTAFTHEFSGVWDFQIELPTDQEGASGSTVPYSEDLAQFALVSRMRLHWETQMAKDWVSHFQIQRPEYSNSILGFWPYEDTATIRDQYGRLPQDAPLSVEIAQAYLEYQWSPSINIRFGQIPLTALSVAQIGYQPAIGDYPWGRSAGSPFCPAGQNMGGAVNIAAGPIRFEFGLWQQSFIQRIWDLPVYSDAIPQGESGGDTLSGITALLSGTTYGIDANNFRGKDITLSYGSRLSLVYNTRPQTHWGIGLGYGLSQLNMPLVIACVGAYDGGSNVPPNYNMAVYNRLNAVAIDATRTYQQWLFQLGYQYQRLRLETSEHYYNNDTDSNAVAEDTESTTRSQAWENNGFSHGWWLQTGYLLWGADYEMDTKNGSVAGIKHNPDYGALELYTRTGFIHRENALALLTDSGWEDLSTHDQATPMTGASPALDNIQTVVLNDQQKYLLVGIDNTGDQVNTTVLVAHDGICYRAHEMVYVFGFSYALNPKSLFKAEYQMTFKDFYKESASGWLDSWHDHRESIFRVRWESTF